MDLEATEACPLIREYHPIFTPELLDVLQLEHVEDFNRLSIIQRHLKDRADAGQANSYDIPSAENSPRCFAAKYLVSSQELQACIWRSWKIPNKLKRRRGSSGRPLRMNVSSSLGRWPRCLVFAQGSLAIAPGMISRNARSVFSEANVAAWRFRCTKTFFPFMKTRQLKFSSN